MLNGRKKYIYTEQKDTDLTRKINLKQTES